MQYLCDRGLLKLSVIVFHPLDPPASALNFYQVKTCGPVLPSVKANRWELCAAFNSKFNEQPTDGDHLSWGKRLPDCSSSALCSVERSISSNGLAHERISCHFFVYHQVD